MTREYESDWQRVRSLMLWRCELLPIKAIHPPSMLIIQLTNNNLVSPKFQFLETVGVRCEYLIVISWLSLHLKLDCLCRELKCKDPPEQRTKTSMKLCHLLLPYERLPPQTTPSNCTAPRELCNTMASLKVYTQLQAHRTFQACQQIVSSYIRYPQNIPQFQATLLTRHKSNSSTQNRGHRPRNGEYSIMCVRTHYRTPCAWRYVFEGPRARS